jgi:hypothetical protein
MDHAPIRRPPDAPGTRRAVLAAGLCALSAGLLAHAASAADLPATEYQVKAAYLYKFASYIEWPAGPASDAATPIVIGVIASDAVAADMTNVLQGQSVANRPIVVRRIDAHGRLDGLNVLFVARTHAGRLPELAAALQGRPVLTVTESEAPGDASGMVNFVVIDDKVKFDIALPRVAHSGLKISARLLAVAHAVTGRDS